MSSSRPPTDPSTPWWRMPIWWLVIGGPAVVVVAGISTAFIAMSAPDPLLDTRAAPPSGERGLILAPAPETPALQARNHAAAAGVAASAGSR